MEGRLEPLQVTRAAAQWNNLTDMFLTNQQYVEHPLSFQNLESAHIPNHNKKPLVTPNHVPCLPMEEKKNYGEWVN